MISVSSICISNVAPLLGNTCILDYSCYVWSLWASRQMERISALVSGYYVTPLVERYVYAIDCIMFLLKL